jgi:hypothetical protein
MPELHVIVGIHLADSHFLLTCKNLTCNLIQHTAYLLNELMEEIMAFFEEYIAARLAIGSIHAFGRLIFNRWGLIFLIICYLIGYAKSEILTAPMYGSIPPGPDSNPSVIPNWALEQDGGQITTIDQRLLTMCNAVEGTLAARDSGLDKACAAARAAVRGR